MDLVKRALIIVLTLMIFFVIAPIFLVGIGVSDSNKLKSFYDLMPFAFNKEKNDSMNVNYDVMVKVYLTKEDKIIEVPIEEYIKGVVCAEMPANFEEEALKAQAVAARTFTLCKLKVNGGPGCSLNSDSDICDSVHCQVYMDKDKRVNSWEEGKRDELWNKIEIAVNETKGQVITYDGKIIDHAQYFAISGGKTEDAVEVFGQDIPYLKSVESDGEEIATKFNTLEYFTRDQLATILNNYISNLNLSSAEVETSIEILERNSSGRVSKLRVKDSVISGIEFRKITGINSTNFNFAYEGDNVAINCFGYGHGVGMSQWGANVMAKNGQNYIDILKHYYTSTEIETLK